MLYTTGYSVITYWCSNNHNSIIGIIINFQNNFAHRETTLQYLSIAMAILCRMAATNVSTLTLFPCL